VQVGKLRYISDCSSSQYHDEMKVAYLPPCLLYNSFTRISIWEQEAFIDWDGRLFLHFLEAELHLLDGNLTVFVRNEVQHCNSRGG
jgi:hypothetical protein